ncbi:hypothetical protein ACTL32_06090 [Planococcus sp. FY231025]|uniref:hypothetical protein n=1 Tax=Planococcus sp. FY231025 TaxID=3455699 RepID=UPI003F90FE20
MRKWLLPILLTASLAACGNEPPEPEAGDSQTEVSAPEGELDPTAPEEVDEAETVDLSAIVNGDIEEGAAVALTATIQELTDDGAFPAFIFGDEEHKVFVRNMAETPVEAGDAVTIRGIYEGLGEENLPVVAASVIEAQ